MLLHIQNISRNKKRSPSGKVFDYGLPFAHLLFYYLNKKEDFNKKKNCIKSLGSVGSQLCLCLSFLCKF